MDKLLKLKIDKIFKELDYLNSDYEYKNEIIQISDKDFQKEVFVTLEEHPELKKLYDKKEEEFHKKVKKKAEESKTDDLNDEIVNELKEGEESDEDIDIQSEESSELISEEMEKVDNKSKKIKKVYRSIVKLTHPDKIQDKKLNQLYIEATDHYDNDNIYGLYIICNELNIDYDIEESEVGLMEQQVKLVKNKINFIQQTFTWRWLNSDENSKRSIIIDFIKQRINSI